MPTSGRSSASSTKTAHTGSGAAQTRGAGTQYFSTPRPTLDCALRRQRILSRVCASNRWRENPGSATGRSPASERHAGQVVGEQGAAALDQRRGQRGSVSRCSCRWQGMDGGGQATLLMPSSLVPHTT